MYRFSKCTDITSVNFSNIRRIGDTGAECAFESCTGLLTAYFPKVVSLDSYALQNIFSGCTSLKEVHFHYSLSANSQCTTSYMGCTNATVYFDLGLSLLTIANYDSSVTYLLNGKAITADSGYCIPGEQSVLIAYKQGYCLYNESISCEEETPISIEVKLTTSGSTYELDIAGAPSTDIETTFYLNGTAVVTLTGDNPSIIVPEGTEITYIVNAKGYKIIKGTLSSSVPSESIALMECSIESYNLSYPFTDSSGILSNFVDGSNFEISASPTVNSGSGIKSSIINGSNSFKINSGVSYGYIKFHTPKNITDTSLLTVSVTCACYAESKYDVGAVYIDTALHPVTSNYKFTGGSGKQDSTYGYVIYSSYGNSSSTYSTYNYSDLQPDTDYYLQFAYSKDSSGNSNWDRFSITNISFTDYS